MTEIEEIFTKCLPSIPSSAADTFAKGMHAYYDAFNTRRESEMNYNKAPDYHNALHDIIIVKPKTFGFILHTSKRSWVTGNKF
jgi:hypothetical protein